MPRSTKTQKTEPAEDVNPLIWELENGRDVSLVIEELEKNAGLSRGSKEWAWYEAATVQEYLRILEHRRKEDIQKKSMRFPYVFSRPGLAEGSIDVLVVARLFKGENELPAELLAELQHKEYFVSAEKDKNPPEKLLQSLIGKSDLKVTRKSRVGYDDAESIQYRIERRFEQKLDGKRDKLERLGLKIGVDLESRLGKEEHTLMPQYLVIYRIPYTSEMNMPAKPMWTGHSSRVPQR